MNEKEKAAQDIWNKYQANKYDLTYTELSHIAFEVPKLLDHISELEAEKAELQEDIKLLHEQMIPKDPSDAERHALKCQNSMNIWHQRYDRAQETIAEQQKEIERLQSILAEAEVFRKNSVGHFDCIASQRDEAEAKVEFLKEALIDSTAKNIYQDNYQWMYEDEGTYWRDKSRRQLAQEMPEIFDYV